MASVEPLVCKNLQLMPSSCTSDFIASLPTGPYTTMRTVRRARGVFEFKHHISRLYHSLSVCLARQSCMLDTIAEDHKMIELNNNKMRDALYSKVVQVLNRGVDFFDAKYPSLSSCDLRITVVLCLLQGHEYDIHTHYELLPPAPSPPIMVAIRPASRRKYSSDKNTTWIRERQTILSSVGPAYNEVLLQEPNGDIYEGLSSNLFIVQNNIIKTAPDGVVKGTVRRVLLKKIREQELPFLLEVPNVHDIDQWSAAFICSTSRSVLPVDIIEFTHDNKCRRISFPESLLSNKLQQLISDNILAETVEVFK